jgi:hypothetical protein
MCVTAKGHAITFAVGCFLLHYVSCTRLKIRVIADQLIRSTSLFTGQSQLGTDR